MLYNKIFSNFKQHPSWWRLQMEIFSALLAICAGNSPVPGEFHAQRPVTRSFDVFFDLGLSNQSWGWWFETLSRPLWRHCNVIWGHVCHQQVSRAGTSSCIPHNLWDVITCPCPWYLLLAQHSSISCCPAAIYLSSVCRFGSRVYLMLSSHLSKHLMVLYVTLHGTLTNTNMSPAGNVAN